MYGFTIKPYNLFQKYISSTLHYRCTHIIITFKIHAFLRNFNKHNKHNGRTSFMGEIVGTGTNLKSCVLFLRNVKMQRWKLWKRVKRKSVPGNMEYEEADAWQEKVIAANTPPSTKCHKSWHYQWRGKCQEWRKIRTTESFLLSPPNLILAYRQHDDWKNTRTHSFSSLRQEHKKELKHDKRNVGDGRDDITRQSWQTVIVHYSVLAFRMLRKLSKVQWQQKGFFSLFLLNTE
jgi:hypothetical protein